jgi:antitoxin component YwqK of YwqJK toxin-antitoxin module
VLRISSRLFLLAVFLAAPLEASPVECLHNGEVIGTSDFASVEAGTVSCQDPVSKIILKETLFKNWMVIQEKIYKNGALQKETSYDGVPGQNKYHGWKNTYSDGLPVREELYEHGTPVLQRVYFTNGNLKLATATLLKDKSQKSRVEFDDQGNLTAIHCSKAVIGPKQKKWCGLDGHESTVALYVNGLENRKLTFLDGHLKVYEQLEQNEMVVSRSQPEAQKPFERMQVDNYSDGRKKSEKRVNFAGRLDGLQRYYEHASEGLVIEELFDDGELRESRIFYPNGRTKHHFVWDKVIGEKRFGDYRSYFSNGAIESKGDCYELAQKVWPVTFDALPTFLKHGATKSWDEDGELREFAHWKDGDRHGVTEYYFTRAGKTRMTRAIYKNGESQTEQDFIASERSWSPLIERQLKISVAPKTKL